eukprot:10616773-Alexandrium_andersonii.AAC.1
MADWQHPVTHQRSKVFAAVDEYTHLPVTAVWATLIGGQEKNITADELFEIFMERWVAYFAKLR